MPRLRKSLLFSLVAAVLLTGIGAALMDRPVEDDLTGRSLAVLRANGDRWASVEASGRDLTLTGTAPTPQEREAAAARVERIHGVRVVTNAAGVLPLQAPYSLTLDKSDVGLHLRGFAPRMEAREKLLSGSVNGNGVTGELTLARGAPDNYMTATEVMRRLSDSLIAGQITLTGTDMTLEGVASSEAAFRSLKDDTPGGLPAGYSYTVKDLVPPPVHPFTLSVTRAGRMVTLAGHVPSDADKAVLAKRAEALGPGVQLSGDLTLASGHPTDFTKKGEAAIALLGYLRDGAVSLVGSDLTVSGDAATPESYKAYQGALGSLPDHVSLVMDAVHPARVAPYTLTVTRNQGGMALGGYVPTADLHGALADAAPSGETVSDDTLIASGAPAGLARAASAMVRMAGLMEAGSKVDLEATTIRLTGSATSLDADKDLKALIAAPPAGFTIDSAGLKPPHVAPYLLSMERQGNKVALSGHTPDSAASGTLKDDIAKAIPGAEIADALQAARGTPDAHAARLAYASQLLAAVDPGKVELSDKKIHVSGTAVSPQDYVKVTALVEKPPADTRVLSSVEPAKVSPFTLTLALGAEGATLTGYQPTPAAKADLEKALKAQGVEAVEDETLIAAGAPDGLSAAASFMAEAAALLTAGSGVALNDQSITLTGSAKDLAAETKLQALLGKAPAGFTIDSGGLQAPLVSPYRLSMKRKGKTVDIAGLAPDLAAVKQVGQDLTKAIDGGAPSGTLRTARGAPDGYSDYARAAAALLAKLDPGEASLSDTALTVSGQAISPTAYRDLGLLAGKPPEGLSIDVSAVKPAAVSPFSFTVVRDAEGCVLEGYLPSDSVRKKLLSLARERCNGAVTDKTLIAGGAPDSFEAAAQLALKAVGDLEPGGKASLEDGKLTLEGKAASAEADATLDSLLASLPAGVTLDREKLAPSVISPYTWEATLDADKVTLRGYVPSEPVGKAIDAAAKAAFGSDAVTDATKVGNGAPKDFEAAAVEALRALARQQSGSAKLSDSELTLTGKAFTKGGMEALQSDFAAALPRGYRSNLDLSQTPPGSPLDRANCDKALTEALADNAIRFASGQATIAPSSYGLLDKLAWTVARCPDARIEVEGHTDAMGNDESNQQLSEARAAAVVDYLTKAGVAAERLKAEGFGETKPVASNDTEEGRAANRRIELHAVAGSETGEAGSGTGAAESGNEGSSE